MDDKKSDTGNENQPLENEVDFLKQDEIVKNFADIQIETNSPTQTAIIDSQPEIDSAQASLNDAVYSQNGNRYEATIKDDDDPMPIIDYEGSKRYIEGKLTDSDKLLEFISALVHKKQLSGTTGGVQLTIEDFNTLRNGEMVNGAIIDAYLELIKARSAKENFPKVHVISSFFYATYKDEKNKAKVRRWVRKVNIFENDIVLFPINDENHWAIVALDLKKSCFVYYDSLEFVDEKQAQYYGNLYVNLVREFVEAEALDRMKIEYYCEDFEFFIQNQPVQTNAIDCGLFLCQFSNFYCHRKILHDFSQSDMIDVRIRMATELLCNDLVEF